LVIAVTTRASERFGFHRTCIVGDHVNCIPLLLKEARHIQNLDSGRNKNEKLLTRSAMAKHDNQPADDASPTDAAIQPTKKHGDKEWMASDKDAAAIPENNMWLVVPSLMLVMFLAALDQTIVTTALPTIASHFDATRECFEILYVGVI
jgi:hypothetical protein